MCVSEEHEAAEPDQVNKVLRPYCASLESWVAHTAGVAPLSAEAKTPLVLSGRSLWCTRVYSTYKGREVRTLWRKASAQDSCLYIVWVIGVL